MLQALLLLALPWLAASADPKDYRFTTDLNNPRMFYYQDASFSGADRFNPIITFYGTKSVSGQIDRLTSLSYGADSEITTFELNGDNTLKLARNSEAQFQLSLKWATSTDVLFEAELGAKSVIYRSTIDLAELFPDTRRLEQPLALSSRRKHRFTKQRLFQLFADWQDDRRRHDLKLRHARQRYLRHSRQLAQESRLVTVQLTTCDQSYNGALMVVDYTNRDDTGVLDKGTVCGESAGSGRYDFRVPVRNSRDDVNGVKQACRRSFATTKPACKTMLDTLHLNTDKDRRTVCKAIADQVNLLRTSEGDDLLDACVNTLKLAADSCDVATGNVINDVCDNPSQNPNRQADRWALTPRIVYPFKFDALSFSTTNAPIPSVRSSTRIADKELLTGPNIVSLEVRPEAPSVGDKYVFSSNVQCVDADKYTVSIQVESTDGFLAQAKCSEVPDQARRGATTCSIVVDGATKKDVRDRCRVQVIKKSDRTVVAQSSIAVIFT